MMTSDDRKFSYKVVAAAILVLLIGWGGMALMGWDDKVAGQVIPPQPAPITDYANYPANNQAPPGCDATGVFGVTFDINGGAPVGHLSDVGPINAGDVLTMSWTGVSDVCGELVAGGPGPIVLAMKSAPGPVFDPTVDQALELPYAFGLMVAGQGGSVSYILPNLLDDNFDGCFGQLDAVVGLPLAVVGPGGSFYGSALRGGGPNLLISWWNGSYENCVPVETTTTTEPPPTTTTAPEATTTTGPPATSTTEPPPSTTEPGHPPYCAGDPTVLSPAEARYCLIGRAPAAAAAPPAARELAVTGSRGGLVPLGLAFLAAGGVLIFVATRKAAKSS